MKTSNTYVGIQFLEIRDKEKLSDIAKIIHLRDLLKPPKQVFNSPSTAFSIMLHWIYIQIYFSGGGLIVNSSSSPLCHPVRKGYICEIKYLVQDLVPRRYYEATRRNWVAKKSSVAQMSQSRGRGLLPQFTLVISNKHAKS